MSEVRVVEFDRVQVERLQVREVNQERQTGFGKAAASEIDGNDPLRMRGIELRLAFDLGEQGEGLLLVRRLLGCCDSDGEHDARRDERASAKHRNLPPLPFEKGCYLKITFASGASL